ncbi:MAG: helicase-related protein [Nocardioides sp.]
MHPGEDPGGRTAGRPPSRRADPGHRSVPRPARRDRADLGAPVIKGETSVKERQRLFDAFRAGEIDLLVVSKVANFSIDLPEAAVAIQVSGSFGSRQEEAQRLGRLLRPKADGRTARFYAIVTRDTVDGDFAANRQRFLAEQGYAYRIVDAGDLPTS